MAISQIQVTCLAHVYYSRPNLDKAVKFLLDFSLVIEAAIEGKIYLRGYGKQPFVYIAEHEGELQKAAAHPDAISSIEDSPSPGGGRMVRLRDPNGFTVGFMYDQREREKSESVTTLRIHPATKASNEGDEKPRKGEFRRFHKGASPVHKLGHYGFILPRDCYQSTVDWYYKTMNLRCATSMWIIQYRYHQERRGTYLFS